jgi:flagellar biosynthesis/type III secretory pathway chaperone
MTPSSLSDVLDQAIAFSQKELSLLQVGDLAQVITLIPEKESLMAHLNQVSHGVTNDPQAQTALKPYKALLQQKSQLLHDLMTQVQSHLDRYGRIRQDFVQSLRQTMVSGERVASGYNARGGHLRSKAPLSGGVLSLGSNNQF